jgi:hypothetical protein
VYIQGGLSFVVVVIFGCFTLDSRHVTAVNYFSFSWMVSSFSLGMFTLYKFAAVQSNILLVLQYWRA